LIVTLNPPSILLNKLLMASFQDKAAVVAPHRVPTTVRDFFFEDPHFQENWENFDKLKTTMFKEPRDLWKKMDTDFRQHRCMRDNIMLDTDRREEGTMPVVAAGADPLARYESGWMFPRRWMLPSLNQELGDLDIFNDGAAHDHDVIRVKEDENQLEVSLDTSHYRPDELHVHVHHGHVTVEGKHEEKSHDGNRTVSRKFVRKYSLPKGVRPENVTSNLASDGVLVVRALKHDPNHEIKIQQIK